MPNPSDIRLEQIGRCKLIKKLGEGGMGLVYRGRHLDLDIDVAVKLLAAHLASQEDMAARFIREARLAARLNHPEIVRVYGCGEEEGYHYLVMEFVDGGSVQGHLDTKGPIEHPLALSITLSVARALGSAQKEVGVIHRDIKPDNIMLTRDGKVKVADLGLAKMVSDNASSAALGGRTATGVAMGTPHYMAPEQFMDAKTVDHRADIFSLGATLYHMLVGSRPFDGETLYAIMRKVVEDEPPPLPSSVPPAVGQIVAKMVAKKAEDRYQDYDVLMEDLQSAKPSSKGAATLIEAAPAPAAPPEVVYSELPPRTQLGLQEQNVEPMTMPGPAARPDTNATIPQAGVKGATADTLPFYGTETGQKRSSAMLPLAIGGGVLALIAVILAVVFLGGSGDNGGKSTGGGGAVVTGGGATPADPLEAEAEAFYWTQSDNVNAGRYGEVVNVIAATKGRYDATKWGVKIGTLATEAKKRLDQKEAGTLVARARRYRADGSLDKAMDKLIEALSLVPDHDEAKRELAQVKAELSAKQVEPKEDIAAKVRPLLASARTMREMGLHQKALEKLTQVLDVDPANEEARTMVVQINKELKAKQATEERKAQYKRWMDEGLRLKLSSKFVEASQAFTRAAEFAPTGSDEARRAAVDCMFQSYRTKGVEAEGKGDLPGAIEQYAKALEIKPDASVQRALTNARTRLEQKRAEDSRTADAKRWTDRAKAAEAQGQIKTALGFYREAAKNGARVQSKISELEARLAMEEALGKAEALVEREQWDQARELLDTILRADPNNAAAKGMMAAVQKNSAPKVEPVKTLNIAEGITMDLAYIAPTTFQMGSNLGNVDEQPVHSVTLTKGFYIGKFEVTKAQYYKVMNVKARRLRDPNNPADNVSWQDALMFCQRLGQMTGEKVRLPTEAEWECACRAGSSGKFCFGDNVALMNEYGWHIKNSSKRSKPVGTKKPNAFGLFDMHGNLYEWCSDAYDQNYYRQSPSKDPTGPSVGAHRVLRGGCAYVDPTLCSGTTRAHFGPTDRNYIVGMRVVVDVSR